MMDEFDGMPEKDVRVEYVFKAKDGEFMGLDDLPEIGDTVKFRHRDGGVTRIVHTEKDGYDVYTVTVDANVE